MSTNGMTSWAVDLKDIGAFYPFQGTEMLLVIALIVFWVGWHVLQIRQENREIAESIRAGVKPESIDKSISDY
jgi:hypothetical protein